MRVCSKQINNWSEEEQLDEEATSDTAIHPPGIRIRVQELLFHAVGTLLYNLWPIRWRGPAAAAAANKYRRREIDVNWKSIQVATTTSRQITVCCLSSPCLYIAWQRFWIRGMRYLSTKRTCIPWRRFPGAPSSLSSRVPTKYRSPVVVWRISIEFTLWGNVD